MPKTQKKNQPKNSHIHFYDDIEQGSDLWHELRKNKITGSQAIKLLNSKNPRTFTFPKDYGFKGNAYTRRGHRLEPEAIELYETINDVKIQHTGFVTNDKYPGAGYSPDGYMDDRTIEVKSFMPKHHLAAIKRPDVDTLAQCHFGQVIMEKEQTDLIYYCPMPEVDVQDQLVVKNIPKNEKIQSNIINRLKEFWEGQNGK